PWRRNPCRCRLFRLCACSGSLSSLMDGELRRLSCRASRRASSGSAKSSPASGSSPSCRAKRGSRARTPRSSCGSPHPCGIELLRSTMARRPGMAGEAFAGRIHQAAAERERRLIREGRRACAVPLACALLLTLAPAAASAQERTGVQVSEEGVRLDFQDADLRMVIAALAELAGLTVVYAELPSRPVTLRSATPVPLAELRRLLESVARANGLVLVDEAGVVRIAPEGAAAAVPAGTLQPLPPRSESAGEDVRLFVHRLRHARAETLAQTLAELFDFGGRTSGGTLAGRRPLSQELRGMRVPPGFPSPDTAAPPPARAFPGEAGAPGRGLAAGLRGPVQVVPDALTNALLIRASPADYETLRAAIEELDARPLQVLIE